MALRPTQTPSGTNPLTDREAAQQEGFLREVDEAVREEQFFGMVKRYGKVLGLAVVLGLGGLGGYLYWDHATQQAHAERAEKTIIALDKVEAGNLVDAAKDLDSLAKDGPAGSRATAALIRAGIAAQEGDAAAAAKGFAAVAADAEAPQPLRDLATIREVALRFDAMKPEDVIARLKPMAVPGNAWFGTAGELVGLAYIRQGKPELAGPIVVAVAKDKSVPESLRARARQLAGQLGFDPIDDANAVAAAPRAPTAAQ